MDKIKDAFRKLWEIISFPFVWVKEEIEFRKRLKKLREQDPFIYK